MVQLGQARVGLAQELMKNSRASHTPCGPTDRQTDRHVDREFNREINSHASSNTGRVNEAWRQSWNTCKMWHAGKLNEWIWLNRSLKMCLLCSIWEWVRKWEKSEPNTNLPKLVPLPRKKDGCTNTHTYTYLHRHPAPRWGLSPLQPSQTRGRGGAFWCCN